MKNSKMLTIMILALALMLWPVEVSEAAPMGTAFTYQGRLMDANSPADGLYDFQFKLFDDPSTGLQQGSTIDINDLDVIDGYYTVELDFGSGVFYGDARWLETTVAHGDGSDPCTLEPRLELTPTPYALYAKTAGGDSDWMVSGNNMYAIPSGNVGIGTSSPDTRLHISGAGAQRLHLESTSAVGIAFIQTSNGDRTWQFGTASSEPFIIQDLTAGPVRMVIDTTGNVGIGTTNPSTKLDVVGTVNATAFVGDGSGLTGIAGDSDWTISGNDMYSAVSGNVGIGTGSPGALLHVDSPAYFGTLLTVSSGTFPKADHLVVKGVGNVGIGTSNPHDGKLVVANYATDEAYISLDPGKGAENDFVGIRASESGNNTTKLHFGREFTSDPEFQDLVTLDGSTGNVGIGTTSPSDKLSVKGSVSVNGKIGLTSVSVWDGTNDNDLTWDGFTISREGSSRRYKQNIRPFQEDFRKVLRLEAKQYQMREGYGKPGKQLFGYIAEELEEIGLTKLLTYDSEGRPDGIKYKKMGIYLIEIVKEQQKIIDEQNSGLAELRTKMERFETVVQKLEAMIASSGWDARDGGL